MVNNWYLEIKKKIGQNKTRRNWWRIWTNELPRERFFMSYLKIRSIYNYLVKFLSLDFGGNNRATLRVSYLVSAEVSIISTREVSCSWEWKRRRGVKCLAMLFPRTELNGCYFSWAWSRKWWVSESEFLSIRLSSWPFFLFPRVDLRVGFAVEWATDSQCYRNLKFHRKKRKRPHLYFESARDFRGLKIHGYQAVPLIYLLISKPTSGRPLERIPLWLAEARIIFFFFEVSQ